MSELKGFFEAKKIAVIGASREEEKVGHVLFKNLLENKYLKVYPINPNADEILGVKAYPEVRGIPFPIDLALIAVKAEIVPEVLEQCGKKGIKNVIIVSAGFSEAGNKALQEKLKEIAEKYEIEVLGPNVLGIINPYKDMNASFFKGIPERGDIAFISQSGALGTSILDMALQNKAGMSAFLPLGNMMQIDFISALEYLAQDKYTNVIMLYIESLKEGTGKKFIELCKKITGKKKIIALKSGKSEKGEKASQSHTASLSSPSEIYSGAFKQAGIIEVESLEEMFTLARILSKYKNLGKRACIITNAGGLGILCTDACIKAGLQVPEIPIEIIKELDSFLPRGYSRNNPLDILGEALEERYGKVINLLSRQQFFDFFIIILSPQAMTQPIETSQILPSIKKPVFACFIGGKSFENAKKLLMQEGIISFDDVSEVSILGKAIGG